jgi:hypothetical protein
MERTILTVSFKRFLKRFEWEQGEHVSFIGPTGSGKTTLSLGLMHRRKYCCVIGTKPADEVLSKFAKDNDYRIIPEFPSHRITDGTWDRLLLWPRLKAFKDIGRQRMAIGHGLQTMFIQKNWAINVDEVSYLVEDLKLEKELRLIWRQGRSIGISLLAGTQRPAHVPLLIYDQATHLFFWRDNDEANLRRIGGIGWLNAGLIRHTVARLPEHHFLYINSRNGQMVISKANKIE